MAAAPEYGGGLGKGANLSTLERARSVVEGAAFVRAGRGSSTPWGIPLPRLTGERARAGRQRAALGSPGKGSRSKCARRAAEFGAGQPETPVMAMEILEELALGPYLARLMSGFEDWGTQLTHEVSSAGA